MLPTLHQRIAGLLVVGMLWGTELPAQQVTISVPQQNVSTGYYEYIGGQWVYFGPGFMLGFGGQSFPQFGRFDPNAGLSGGFAFGSGGTGGQFNFNAAAGGSTTFSSYTPMLTVTNGVPGYFFEGQLTPFVTGIVPTVSNPVVNNPAFQNLGAANTLAGRMQRGEFHIRHGRVHAGPDPRQQLPPELAAVPNLFAPLPVPGAIRQEAIPLAQIPMDESAAEVLWDKGQQLEAEGKPGAARLLYQSALRQAQGGLRHQLETRLRALE